MGHEVRYHFFLTFPMQKEHFFRKALCKIQVYDNVGVILLHHWFHQLPWSVPSRITTLKVRNHRQWRALFVGMLDMYYWTFRYLYAFDGYGPFSIDWKQGFLNAWYEQEDREWMRVTIDSSEPIISQSSDRISFAGLCRPSAPEIIATILTTGDSKRIRQFGCSLFKENKSGCTSSLVRSIGVPNPKRISTILYPAI